MRVKIVCNQDRCARHGTATHRCAACERTVINRVCQCTPDKPKTRYTQLGATLWDARFMRVVK